MVLLDGLIEIELVTEAFWAEANSVWTRKKAATARTTMAKILDIVVWKGLGRRREVGGWWWKE
jgi:hypothetical protein